MSPSWIDWTILGGTVSFFLFLFLLFLRFVPFIPISELKEMRHKLEKERAASAGRTGGAPCLADWRRSSTPPEALAACLRCAVTRRLYECHDVHTVPREGTRHEAAGVDRPLDHARCAGHFGAVFGYLLQWWCNGKSYPINVGGRPLNSIPAFIPISFESAVLASTLAGFVSMLWFSGLPRLSHPMFSVNGFDRATVDRFWVAVDSRDPRFDELARPPSHGSWRTSLRARVGEPMNRGLPRPSCCRLRHAART